MLEIYDETGKKKVSMTNDRNDNAVAIKRKLYDIAYKSAIQLQLLSDGKPLDNNRYLPDGTTRLDYRIIKGDSSDVIIKVDMNKYNIPTLIQINKRHSIGQLESVLKYFCKGVDRLAIFTESGLRLETRSTVEQSGLVNDCKIRVCDEKDVTLSLTVANILRVDDSFQMKCSNFETISEVKKHICSRLRKETSDIALFSATNFLKTERRLNNYSIGNRDSIFYVNMIRKDKIDVGKEFKTGQFATLHYGRNKTTETDVVVKKYSLHIGNNLSKIKPLKYEITTFLKLKEENNSRFVKLISMFEEKSNFFIVMEHMKGGSLDTLVPLNKYFHNPKRTIIKFSIQILEGLAFLHEKRFLYRNMKCSSVLLDETRTTVKLCSFQFSKFMQGYNKEKLVIGEEGSQPAVGYCAPPEMQQNKEYGVNADIWSFGATLIEMVTGKPPDANLKPQQVNDKMTTLKKIEYTQPGWMSDDLKNIIEECLKPNQKMRPSANKLKRWLTTM